MKRPRVLLADDHPIVVAGLRDVLGPQFEIVGAAEDGGVLVDLALDLEPDVILLDISMPLLNGFTAARQIRKRLPRAKLIFLSMHSEADYVDEAFRVGASGYILKRSAASELAGAIEAVLNGQTYVSPAVARAFELLSPELPARFDKSPSGLTDRKREVLQLLAEGHSSKEIATILHVTIKTVEFHKAMIKRTLRLQTTAELIKYAVEHKITGA